jgi:hypothetical protein
VITLGSLETDHIIRLITISKSTPHLLSFKIVDWPLPN